ncbi:MAG: dynamin family protein [Campylobacterales bacterium]
MEQFEQLKVRAVEVLREAAEITEELKRELPIEVLQQELDQYHRGLIEVAEMIPREQLIIGVVAPVSSGKSTFLNGLVFEEPVLDSRIGETTAALYRIQHGSQFQVKEKGRVYPISNLEELKERIKELNRERLDQIKEGENLGEEEIEVEISIPDQRLLHITLLDTPGYGSVNEQVMNRILEKVSRESDGIVVILDISKGLMEKDRQFLKDVLERNFIHDGFFILNKMDGIIDPDELELKSREEIEQEIQAQIAQVVEELQKIVQNSSHPFQIDQRKIFPMSAKKGLVGKKLIKEGREEEGRKRLEESRLPEFEEHFWAQLLEVKAKKGDTELARGKELLEGLEEGLWRIEQEKEESRRRLERLREAASLLDQAERSFELGRSYLNDSYRKRELKTELVSALRERLEDELSDVGWSLSKESWENATQRAIRLFSEDVEEEMEGAVNYIKYEINNAGEYLEKAAQILREVQEAQQNSLHLTSRKGLPATNSNSALRGIDVDGILGDIIISLGLGVGVGLAAELIAGRLIAFAIPGIGWLLGAAAAFFTLASAGNKKDEIISKVMETAPVEIENIINQTFSQLKTQLDGVENQLAPTISHLREEIEKGIAEEKAIQQIPAQLIERLHNLRQEYPI